MAACNKRSYAYENLALDALISARINFVGNSASNIYQCENCGNWHLTSSGPLHPKLLKALSDGEISKAQTALRWESKFKKF
jgi:hypothetical protein